jgi:hypothetical protein
MTCGGSHLGYQIGIKKKKLFSSLVSIVQVVSEKKRFETFSP